MEQRVDRYASGRGEEAHRRGVTGSQQLDTGQRDSSSLDKEMEARMDRYASGRDTYARDAAHSGKETSSTYDWKRRDRSSATQWSPPFTSSSSSVQEGSGRFHGGFDLPTSTSSPQPSPFSGASSLLGTDIAHDETSHMSPPKRPRPSRGEGTDSGHDEASHPSVPTTKRPRLGWGQGLAKYEKKKGTDGEDCSKGAHAATKDENVKKTNALSEEETSAERASKPGNCPVSSSSTARTLLPEIGSDKFVSPVEGEVHRPDGSSINLELSNDARHGNAVHGFHTSTSEVFCVSSDTIGPSGDPLTSQAPGHDFLLSKDPINTICAQKKDSSEDKSLQEGSPQTLQSKLVSGLPSDMSGWSKEAIAQQLLILEAEVEVVEKELAKLAREDDGDTVDEATLDSSVFAACELVDMDEHNKANQSESPQESGAPDTKASDLEVEVTTVVTSVEVAPAALVADKANSQVIEVQVLPSVEELSISTVVEDAHTEANDPSKSDSECQTLQDSDEQMPLTGNSEQCESLSCACHGPDCGLCDVSDDDDEELPATNLGIGGLSDLMFYRYVFSIWNLILENRRLARKALEPFQHLLLKDENSLDFKVNGSLENTTVWIQNEERHIKNQEQMMVKLSERKKMLTFKERVLAVKYRALKDECYQGQLGLCHRRDRVKPVRRWEVERRTAANFAVASQRSTLRLRPIIAGPTRLYTGQEDAHTRRRFLAMNPANRLRQDLKMPEMILDEKERCSRRFLSRNGLVEDPVSFEQERKSVNPWTDEEKTLFLEKFPLFNKNFSKIASYFQHKTTADCIEFYYRNQKSEDFEKIKRRRQQLKKRRDYSLSASQGVKSSRGSSHKVVEKARPVSTYDSGNLDQLVVKSGFVKENKSVSSEVKEMKAVSASDAATSGISPCSHCIGTPSTSKNYHDKLSVKGGSAFVTPFGKVSSVEEHGDRKGNRTSPVLRDVVVENEDNESQWTDFERDLFLDAIANHGKDFKSISEQVVSKTPSQCRTFYSKIRKRYRLDDMAEQAPETSPMDVGGLSSKSPAEIKVKLDVAGESALDNSKSTDLGIVDMQKDSNAAEGMCKVEVVEGNEMADGLSLLGEAVVNNLTNIPSENTGDETKECCDAKEARGEDSASKGEELVEAVTVCPTVDDQKQREQSVKVEPETEVPVVENVIRVQNDASETSTVKDEGGRVESGMVVYGDPNWTSATPTSLVDPCCTLKAHEEDLGPGRVVVKAEPFVSLDTGAPSYTGVPLVTTQQSASVPVTSPLVTQSGPIRERGARLNAAGEFKPRREPTSWTQEEKEKFAEIIRRHGKDWTLLDESLPGKSMTQIKTYFQNSKAKLGFLSTDGLANPGTRGTCNRKRKPEESDTSSNAGSAGQICPPKVTLPGEDVLQKVVSSSMMAISTSVGTAGVGGDGVAYSHFNPGNCQPGEDSAARDLQKMIRRICSASEYGAQSNIVGGILPIFQPGISSAYPGPNSQQSLLLAAQKQQLMVGHPTAQQVLPTQVGLQQQQQPALTNHKQQQLISHVVQQLQQQAVQQLQQQQQQTNQLVVHQPQMVHQLQQLVQMQQQQQQHLAQVAKHIPPQLVHQQSHQHLPLGPNVVHQQQMVSRAKLAAAGVQQQVGHVSRLHPSHTQQQLFQQQQQIIQQQKQQQLILQQIQATQLQHDLQLHQQMQVQKQQQQLPQHHHQQQQLQHGQPLALFRGSYQSSLAEAELLRHSEVVEQRNTPANLGLLPREDLQVQSQRAQQNLAQQQQARAPPSSESQRLRMGDVKLFGQSLLSQPQPNTGTPSISNTHKTGQPASPATTAPSASSASKYFVVTEPTVLAPPAFNRQAGTALVGEGSQSWPLGSVGNLDLWNSMMGGLQGGGSLYKNEDASKLEVCSVHEAITKMTARPNREGHELEGDDLHNAPAGGISNDHQRSTDAACDLVRIGASDASEGPNNDGHIRMENEWRIIPRANPAAVLNAQGGYSHVVLDPHYPYSGERQSITSQGVVNQTWDGVRERDSNRNSVESGIGTLVPPALASEMISQQINSRSEVYAPLSLPLPAAAAVTKISSWPVSGSLALAGESVGGSFQSQGVILRGLPDVEQPCTMITDSKSKNVDNSGGPG
ncbi:protein MpRR-MYB1 [Marchantia polymorpha subsp. ruderalis]|uniref:Nuclear receptor corepressor 1 n=2 Tax=Marchantia polymorpha TaxID=3197 RepID=A0AAF6ASP3_MARPO|nr:hypothetical protein MARPO_0001s0480 [Marchantia polymorpha]BBM99462.1 hypothetical protein Mp_1g21450 [Marchantia polymorpha subsp. ruderalis]PTQ50544.1 hypothetical protein MARPO_0001s0480 [Marchantia polymorpha]PTQ50545.1 hypothetical protein MARPO_0001s0480 [Marchantia polymorpha]BBM99463.1 hypothetical protein Mp_1g21450 [Marchantia polymorpha subsp. ruderalis]|eukprot:PTQ50543.1 hypothetical protein MARPO_0001s0480 [Marchantia polymorpha]